MVDCQDQNNKCVSFNFSMINSIFLALRMWGGNQNYSLPVLPSGQRDPIVPLSREFRSFMRRSLRHTKIKFSWYEIVHICMKPFFEEKSISYSKDQKSAYICWFCQVVLSGNHHSSAKALLSYFLSDGIKATELSCSIKKNVKISAKEIPLPIEQQNRIYSKLVLALEILWRRILAMNHMKCTGKGC